MWGCLSLIIGHQQVFASPYCTYTNNRVIWPKITLPMRILSSLCKAKPQGQWLTNVCWFLTTPALYHNQRVFSAVTLYMLNKKLIKQEVVVLMIALSLSLTCKAVSASLHSIKKSLYSIFVTTRYDKTLDQSEQLPLKQLHSFPW